MYRKRIYFNLLHTKVHLLYGCTFFFLLIICGFWWLQLYKPLVASNQALENDLTITFKKLQSEKTSEKLAKELQKKFSNYKSVIPNLKKDAMLCSLVSFAQKNNLQVISARLCRQKNKAWCSWQEIQIECRGLYDQIISLFEQLANYKPIISCKSCDITRNDKDTFTMRALFATYLV
ncbi:MAG: hypothetical protein AMXMBFR12_06090 [Candidatus Babeliales bacterium]